jgi:hypothetical protein
MAHYSITPINEYLTHVQFVSLEEATDVVYSAEEIQELYGLDVDRGSTDNDVYHADANWRRGRYNFVISNVRSINEELQARFSNPKTKRVSWADMGLDREALERADLPYHSNPAWRLDNKLNGPGWRNSDRAQAFLRGATPKATKKGPAPLVTKMRQHQMASALCQLSLNWFATQEEWAVDRMARTNKWAQLRLIRFMLKQGCPRTLLQERRSTKNTFSYATFPDLTEEEFAANVGALYEWVDTAVLEKPVE